MAPPYFVRLIVSFALCLSASAQTITLLHGRGVEWLSWTPVQRTAYVQGFADGYMIGFHNACDLADQLFETGQPHRLGDEHHPTEVPSGRCLAHRGEFSKASWMKRGNSMSVPILMSSPPFTRSILHAATFHFRSCCKTLALNTPTQMNCMRRL